MSGNPRDCDRRSISDAVVYTFYYLSSTHRSRGIPDIGRILRVIICQIVIDRCLLVIGHRKVVAEATSRIDDLFTSPFRLIDRRIRVDLSSANRCDVGASSWETGVEDRAIQGISSYEEH